MLPTQLYGSKFYQFPWATGANRERARLGNLFIDMMVEAVDAAFSSGALFFIEHPEDLGVTWNGGDPSSIWAWPEVLQLLERTGAATAALFQCKFGFRSQKPTRVAGTLPGIAAMPWRGYPRFNKAGSYIGPLPKSCGCDVKHVGLIGRRKAEASTQKVPPPILHPCANGLQI